MRPTSLLRKLTASPLATHVGDTSQMWAKVRKALVVNPDSNTGAPLVLEHRWPQPASRPEKFSVPSSKASDVAANPYWQRDFRRQYPKTEVLTQAELSTLLIAQGGINSLPAPSSATASSTALTADAPAPSLSAIYTSPSAVAAPSFKAPTPPGAKYRWFVAKEEIPHDADAYFPMWSASSERIA